MGAITNPQIDFITRTLQILNQYEYYVKPNVSELEYYNHTLIINLSLGIIVAAKPLNNITYFPKITIAEMQKDYDLFNSYFDKKIEDTHYLIGQLRDSIAHFDIEFVNNKESNTIERIVFKNKEKSIEIANFSSADLFKFVISISNFLIANYEKYKTAPTAQS